MNTNDIINGLVANGVPHGDAVTLAAVAFAESGYNPGVEGDKTLGSSIGLFQIHLPAHRPKLIQWTGSQDRTTWIKWLSDPWNNIKAAAAVYHSQGLGAWTTYKTGAYRQYLGQVKDVAGYAGDASPDPFGTAWADFRKLEESLGDAIDPAFGNPVFPEDDPGVWDPVAGKWVNKAGQSYGGGPDYIPDEEPLQSGGAGGIFDLSGWLPGAEKLTNKLLTVLAGVACLVLGFFLITKKEGNNG